MAHNPYSDFPDTSYWRKSISALNYKDVDPLLDFDIKINQKTKVATGGSCFAQHIARYLKLHDFNYYLTEKGHDVLPATIREEFNYGTFSARYGNIYTSRQLLQLLKRAFGELLPKEDFWQKDNYYIDPYRPNIQPYGFSSLKEFNEDRTQHFRAVREVFKTLDVFVFTLGLTECWQDEDGTVFPLCPGVAGGQFDAEKHSFLNLGVDDVVNDLDAFLLILKDINPKAKVILTVSPVPLIATATENHVLSSTTYSKSVLRVSAEQIRQKYENVSYFPSFEIITGSYSRGEYFSDDLRNVTEDGVQHVMRVFFKHIANMKLQSTGDVSKNSDTGNKFLKEMKTIVDVICEEDLLDKAK